MTPQASSRKRSVAGLEWATRAKLSEFEVVGKVALYAEAEARKTRQGVRLWFAKPD